jgi:4-hydroxy-3-methylbut-2-enyl diphosphate reductase IspH
MMRGIGISQRGKVEMFSRLAYIAGIKRAIEIVEQHEKEQQDGKRRS